MKLTKTCLVCKKLFSKPYHESVKNWIKRHKFCSKKCVNKSPRSEETRLKQRQAKLGKSSWNKGKKLSELHKLHLRKKHKPISDTSNMRGRRPWNKIGDGITPINERIRRSPEYKQWRKKVFERDKSICIWCGQRGGNLEADHIKSFSQYPKLRFIVSNGRVLCKACHRKTKTWGNKSRINKIAKNTNAA